ncbi:MAG: GIY-YIG nuclease family protein [Parcubacteria group bacterium]|nr:GIY-YIG nuclease family protein [Parcubacteria group bacterium]
MWFTYIIKCEDNSFYTGATNDLDKRFQAHKQGKGGKYTASHKPVKIVFFERFKNRSEAQKREMEIKKLTHNQKKDLVESLL